MPPTTLLLLRALSYSLLYSTVIVVTAFQLSPPARVQQHRTTSAVASPCYFTPSSSSRSTCTCSSRAQSCNGIHSPFITRLQASTAASASSETTSSSSSSSSASERSNFENFDYLNHWYPVAWAQDIPLNKPTKVTVFDVDYVVGRTRSANNKEQTGEDDNNDQIFALVDKCPHKLAALSEGRITACGSFQCAYHGWSFDGTSGKCLEVPQTMTSGVSFGDRSSAATFSSSGGRREDAKAVPAMISQGMVWLFPGGGLEKALLAPEPPQVAEMDIEGFRSTQTVRDFPVDWTILAENIMDPDHGLFAHGVPGFDLYSASRDAPQTIVEEDLNDGKGWKITSTVDAVEKLIQTNTEWKIEEGKMKRKKDGAKGEKAAPAIRKATTTFVAPSLVYSCRRDAETGETTFVTAFWICPVGTGRSRFMSAAIGKIPFSPPRWLVHIGLNNFLDQDTYLLYTQQKNVLEKEAELAQSAASGRENEAGADEQRESSPNTMRKSLFVYRSPTEKLQARLASFFDNTINKVPNRRTGLRNLPRLDLPREVVLDRFSQHTKICPDTMSLYNGCKRANRVSLCFAGLAVLSRMVIPRLCFTSSPLLSTLCSPALLRSVVAVSGLISFISNRIQREFRFKYDESYRDRDLDNIPNVWMDR